MYVNPLWFGVLATILVELLACIVYAGVTNSRGGKK